MGASAGFGTYTIKTKKKLEDGRIITTAELITGAVSDTYPSTGIPLSNGKLGFSYGKADSVSVVDGNANGSADGNQYKWDNVNNSIRIYQDHTEIATSSTVSGIDIIVMAIGY